MQKNHVKLLQQLLSVTIISYLQSLNHYLSPAYRLFPQFSPSLVMAGNKDRCRKEAHLVLSPIILMPLKVAEDFQGYWLNRHCNIAGSLLYFLHSTNKTSVGLNFQLYHIGCWNIKKERFGVIHTCTYL